MSTKSNKLIQILKKRWVSNLICFVVSFLIATAVRPYFKGTSTKKSVPEETSVVDIAEKCILKQSDKVMVNGYHVIYDDGVPLTINNAFNPAKTRKFNIITVNGEQFIYWSQTYGDFLDHLKGSPKIGYQSSNKNFLVKCCIDDATAKMALRQDLDLLYHSVQFKYVPYFEKLNKYQKAALLAYHYELGIKEKQPDIYRRLGSKPDEAWIGMKGNNTRKIVTFKKLYMTDPKK